MHLDLTYIHENVAQDDEFVVELLHVFLDSLEPDLSDLDASIEQENHHAIKLAAHKVKSSFRSLGMKRPWEILQKIEDIAYDHGSMSEVTSLKNELDRLLPGIKREVALFIENHS